MRESKEEGEFKEPHRHDRFWLFMSFLGAALLGYIITNHVTLLGV